MNTKSLMTLRSVTPVVFTILCLALSGLVLRRQISAHPRLTSESTLEGRQIAIQRQGKYRPNQFPPGWIGLPVDKRSWHIVGGSKREAVIDCIQGQLDAFRAGDGVAASSFMRQRKGQHFPSQLFQERIQEMAPEFGRSRSASYGPVWTDKEGQHADVFVKVVGEDGKLAGGTYKLVRQEGVYRVAGLRDGGWMGE